MSTELDNLPTFVLKWPCKTCGYEPSEPDRFPPCNIDETGQVTYCDKCKERCQ